MKFFASFDFAQSTDKNTATRFVRFTIGGTRMVDPSRIVAAIQRIDHIFFADVKVKRVVGIARVVGMALLRFFPTDDLAGVFDDDFAFGDRHQGKHPFAMNA
ncbi:MAG: hypothetical protein RL631_1131 [Pseudomonadota bacterium]